MKNEKLDKVKAKIRALTGRTTAAGCTEAEALAAVRKISDLIQEYNINMTDVEAREEKIVTTNFCPRESRMTPIHDVIWEIATFTGCEAWYHKSYPGAAYEYFFMGLRPDASMARYLAQSIFRARKHELEVFEHTPEYYRRFGLEKRAASRSFEFGMAERLIERMYQETSIRERMMREENASSKHPGAAGSSVNALIVIKQDRVTDAFKRRHPDLRETTYGAKINPMTLNAAALAQGRTAGDRVDLTRPITESGPSKRLRNR